jgi:hypothetical protein
VYAVEVNGGNSAQAVMYQGSTQKVHQRRRIGAEQLRVMGRITEGVHFASGLASARQMRISAITPLIEALVRHLANVEMRFNR